MSVVRQYLGEVSGVGDDVPVPQYEYQCERDGVCFDAGLMPQCPLSVLRR